MEWTRHFSFVGLTSRFDESACLWAFTFREPDIPYVEPRLRHRPPLSANRHSNGDNNDQALHSEGQLPKEVETKLRHLIDAELQVYELVESMFEQRMALMYVK